MISPIVTSAKPFLLNSLRAHLRIRSRVFCLCRGLYGMSAPSVPENDNVRPRKDVLEHLFKP
jgi:hypothetical protein